MLSSVEFICCIAKTNLYVLFFLEMYEAGDESDEVTMDMWQESCWIVISSYFDEKGKFY